MIHYNLEQGSTEWLSLRLGKPTASHMADIMGKGETRAKYMRKLAAEAISGQVEETYTNAHMARGNEQEPIARAAYEARYGVEVVPVAFVDCGTWGASPDGIVGNDGGIEIKSRIGSVQVETIESGKVPSANMPQINACMLALDREWWDYVSYSTALPLFVKRCHRSKEADSAIIEALARFNAELEELIAKVRKYA